MAASTAELMDQTRAVKRVEKLAATWDGRMELTTAAQMAAKTGPQLAELMADSKVVWKVEMTGLL